jgi:opacity protein-like surface antigen
MKKIILALSLVIISGVSALAQSTATDYKKAEVFVGYSNGQVDTGANRENSFNNFFEERLSFHGLNVSAVGNVSRYVGIKADVSGTYRNKNFNIPSTGGPVTFDTNNSLYNFLGGVQFKDNASTGRVKPFAYALAGAGYARTKIKNVNCPTGVNCSNLRNESETGLAGAFGGGVDVRLSERIDFRLIKVDYNPIRFENGTQHNVRLGVGFVFK